MEWYHPQLKWVFPSQLTQSGIQEQPEVYLFSVYIPLSLQSISSITGRKKQHVYKLRDFVNNRVGGCCFYISIQAAHAERCAPIFLNYQNIEPRGSTKRALLLCQTGIGCQSQSQGQQGNFLVVQMFYSLTDSSNCHTVLVKTWALWCGDKLLLTTPQLEWGRIPNYFSHLHATCSIYYPPSESPPPTSGVKILFPSFIRICSSLWQVVHWYLFNVWCVIWYLWVIRNG